MAQYIRIVIAITVLILSGEITSTEARAGESKEASQRLRTNGAPDPRSIDWYETLMRLLDHACEVLVCDLPVASSTASLESKIEWWNHLYRVGGVRKGMPDAERHRATTIVREMRVAVLNAGDKIDPDLGDRFLRTLHEAERVIASGGELPVTGHQRPPG